MEEYPPIFQNQVTEDTEAVALAGAGERQVPFVFSGSGGEFFKIWIVNVLLSILTIGIYSAWAKVRTLRYFYGNTSLNGSAFEYLASPVKILKGRLIVFAFFMVFSVANKFYPWISLLLGPIILLLTPWVVRQSLRFRHHYTVWRGVRFAFAGGLWDAAKAFVLWPIVPFVSLVAFVIFGYLKTFFSSLAPTMDYFTIPLVALLAIVSFFALFAIPIPWHRQTHYLADNSRFGAASFKNHSTEGDFFGVFFILVFIALLSCVIAFFVSFLIVSVAPTFMTRKITDREFFFMAIPYFLVVWTIITAMYKARMTNLRFGKTTIGSHRLVSSYATGSYLALVITNTLATIFTLGFFYPFAKVRTARYAAEHTAMIIDGNLDGFVADRQAEVSALGSEAGDFLDIDIGF